ncbi:hypothetical protein [Pseudogracilibacillus auburnensis]|uniref:hypothetical protein n=1 Tax=Pseudogracilibacillus auburnensis TaxID=1494959 RepID=UPI001A959B4E|nr:hypothetical protein [Pseudogracilibacillus auburnensis]MBO1001641.1 hypothetical protein [Pseudogracilibacillus auburnensis]
MKKDNRVFFSVGSIDKEDAGVSYYTLSQGEVAEYYSQLVDVDNFQEVFKEMTYPAQAEEI